MIIRLFMHFEFFLFKKNLCFCIEPKKNLGKIGFQRFHIFTPPFAKWKLQSMLLFCVTPADDDWNKNKTVIGEGSGNWVMQRKVLLVFIDNVNGVDIRETSSN